MSTMMVMRIPSEIVVPTIRIPTGPVVRLAVVRRYPTKSRHQNRLLWAAQAMLAGRPFFWDEVLN